MAMPQVIIQQAQSNPRQAAGFVSGWPMPLPKSTISEIAGVLLEDNAEHAFDWAGSITDTDNRQNAYNALYALRVRLNPATAPDALAWVGRIQDPNLHIRSFNTIAPIIDQNNPDCLSAWLQDRKTFSPEE